jgi:hypothetical protein
MQEIQRHGIEASRLSIDPQAMIAQRPVEMHMQVRLRDRRHEVARDL